MPLEKITERILEDGKLKAAEIRRNAEAKAEQIVAKAQERAEAEKVRILLAGQRSAAEEKKKILTMAQLEARNEILAAKQRVIDQVFSSALQKLVSLPDKQYKELIKKMLLKSCQGGEEIIISPSDKKRITPEFVKAVGAALGKKDGIRLSDENRDLKGGFILKAGRIEINNSFESLIDSLREELEPQVAEILFGGK